MPRSFSSAVPSLTPRLRTAGKTTSARVIASQAALPLVYVPLETIVSKWYGESEANMGKLFKACGVSECVGAGGAQAGGRGAQPNGGSEGQGCQGRFFATAAGSLAGWLCLCVASR